MIFMNELGKVPHATLAHPKLKGEETIQLYNTLDAYKDLQKLVHGAFEMVKIVDAVADKHYALTEVMYAGILLTDGIDGTYSDDYFSGKGKYVRIDKHEIVVIRNELIFTEDIFLENSYFYADSGEKYQLKAKRKKKR